MRDLRPHQVEIINQLRRSLSSGHRRPMIQAPTGAGKTVVAGAIVKGAMSKGKRVLFVVPAVSLIDQTVRSFFAEGIHDVGVIQGDHPMTDASKTIQVASIQTLQRRAIPRFDIVVIDEAHRWFEMLGVWMKAPDWASVPFVGLSATPWTKGLGKYYDDLVQVTTTKELIEAGYLSQFRVYAPTHPDLKGVRTVAGDYHEGDLGKAMNQPKLVADIVQTWQRHGGNRPTFVFAVDRAHAKALQNKFTEADVSTGYIDAYTKPADREAIFRQFTAGTVRVITSVGCLTTGVDLDVRCIVLARPTKSEMLFVQIIGRGLRTADGKDDCLILDHSDTHLRLGFVTDIHHDTLDDGRERQKRDAKAREEALPKECTSCKFLKPAKVAKCPACGFKAEKQSKIECDDGQLIEMTPARARASTIEKESLFGQLKYYAKRRDYSEGWAAHKFRELTGVWPDRYHNAAPREPTAFLLNWIKSRQIAYVKAKGGSNAQASR